MIAALLGGLGLTGIMMALLWAVWGVDTLVAAVTFGLVATAIQIASAWLVQPVAHAPFPLLIRRWSIGMGLRVLGIAIFGVASWTLPELFPPLPAAFAYLGVVVPLLFLEIRFLR